MSVVRCSNPDCRARMSSVRFRLCRVCRAKAAVRKAAQRARGRAQSPTEMSREVSQVGAHNVADCA